MFDHDHHHPSPDALRDEVEQLRARLRETESTLQDVLEAARAREEELAREAEEKDRFIAMMAHELRNPLAPILSSVHTLRLRGLNEEESSQRLLAIIERQARHMARLIDDLLDLSRITRGQIELHREMLDLGHLVRLVVDNCRPLADARSQTLDVTLPREGLPVEGDSVRLEQAIGCLLLNAIKFTRQGGKIWIRATHGDGQVALLVRDNGLGLSPEILSRVFDPFFQAAKEIDRSQGGLGLGLTLARGLVELHGGRIEARSEGEGKGSEFIITLPAFGDIQAANPVPDTGGEGREPAAARILIVEDNLDAASSMAELISMWGYDVMLSHDGVQAVQKAIEFHPDVMLLDIGLPNMNGYQVAKLLRQREDLAEMMIVATTGYGQPKDVERSHFVGIDHHLTKPINLEELRRLLTEKVGRAA